MLRNIFKGSLKPVTYFVASGVFIFRNEQTCFVLFSCILCFIFQTSKWDGKWNLFENTETNDGILLFFVLPNFYKHEYLRRVLSLPVDDVGHIGVQDVEIQCRMKRHKTSALMFFEMYFIGIRFYVDQIISHQWLEAI